MSDYSKLSVLGLSKLAIACYQELYEGGNASAGQLTRRLNAPRSSIYRTLKRLETTGFVHGYKIPRWSYRYQATRLDKALENLAIYQRRQLRDLVEDQVEKSLQRQASIYNSLHNDWREKRGY